MLRLAFRRASGLWPVACSVWEGRGNSMNPMNATNSTDSTNV